jgi:LysR family transcriptional regulator (chromosome initiation inhibitor)
MKMLDYDLLATLASVVREGSFDGASGELNITQSAISQRIKLLEAKVGAILVVRGRPCTATEIGNQLCQHVNQVSLFEHDLFKSIQKGQPNDRCGSVTIRIAVNADSIATWFAGVVTLAASELGILFDIIPDDQEHTAECLRNGDALAAVTADVKPLHGFRKAPIGSLDYVAVSNPSFLDAHFKAGVNAATISKAPCLIFDRKDMISRNWVNKIFGTTVPLSAHWIPSFPGYLECCCNGAGWGLVPRLTASPYLLDGRLVEFHPSTDISIPLFWLSSTNVGETMQALSKIVVAIAREQLAFDTN